MVLVDDDFRLDGENEDAGSEGLGPVLTVIGELREEMTRVTDRLVALEKKTSELIVLNEALKTGTSEIKATLASMGPELTTNLEYLKEAVDEGGRARRVRLKGVPRVPTGQLLSAVGPKRAVKPILTWKIMTSVLSFLHAMPSLRFWVSDSLWSHFLPFHEIVAGSQGLAVLLFSMQNNTKSLLGSGPGKLWALVLKHALIDAFVAAKNVLHRPRDETGANSGRVLQSGQQISCGNSNASDGRSTEPAWLARFRDNTDIITAVTDAMEKFCGVNKEVSETSSTVELMTRPRKRRKASDTGYDLERLFRRCVVEDVRSKWLDQMSAGRGNARKHVFLKLAFILDKIEQSGGVTRAADRGYSINLSPFLAEMHDIQADTPNLLRSVWNIDDAVLKGCTPPVGALSNSERLEKLKNAFPFLHGSISYKQRVVTDTSIRERGRFESVDGEERTVTCTETFYLHDIALSFLMEISGGEARSDVLEVSQLSLKAVHVLALAFRGLIVQTLKKNGGTMDLSAVERAAFGTEVSLSEKDKIQVMMQKIGGDGKLLSKYVECAAMKFEISEAEVMERGNAVADGGSEQRNGCSVAMQPAETAVMMPGDWTSHR